MTHVLFLSGTQHVSYIACDFFINATSTTEHRVTHYTDKDIFDFPERYDVGIGFLYAHKISADQLNVPWINFHPGPLPDYKGRNLIYHAIMNEEKEFGITLHYMNENFDCGDIIEVKKFSINNDMNAADIIDKTHYWLLKLLKKYTNDILSLNLPVGILQSKHGKYYKYHPISNEVILTKEQQKQIRAVTTNKHKAIFQVGNRIYNLVEQSFINKE